MDCPLCKINLQIADRQGVEIDYCSKCRGIWLDRGELEKLIELAVVQVPFSSSPFMDRSNEAYRLERRPESDDDRFDDRYDRSDQHDGKTKKKESWLRNLLDFD